MASKAAVLARQLEPDTVQQFGITDGDDDLRAFVSRTPRSFEPYSLGVPPIATILWSESCGVLGIDQPPVGSSASIAPSGTPVCLTENVSDIRCAGVVRISRWELAGVIGP